jgi:hypothetical protein
LTKKKGFWFLKGDGSPCPTPGSSPEVLLNYFIQLNKWIMEDFKIYIFAIWKISKYTYSLYKNHFFAV